MNIEQIQINRRNGVITSVEAIMSDGTFKTIPQEVVDQFMEIISDL